MTTRIGVLASGGGTNLQAILDAGLPVVVVVTDRPGVSALDRAAAVGIATVVVDRDQYLPDRESFTRAVTDALVAHEVDLVAMAGFMTVLAEPIFEAFPNRVINTHPALLPSFRGAQAVPDALAAGVKVTGCTIHIATVEVDDGPILAQEAVPVLPGDDEDALHERIKAVEHRLYPKVLADLVAAEAGAPPTEDGWVEVRRALVSVYDKAGLLDFARGLHQLGDQPDRLGGNGHRPGRGGHPRHAGRGSHRRTRDALRAGQDPPPPDPRRDPGRPGRPLARGRPGRPGHRAHRPGRGQPLPLPGAARRSRRSTSAGPPWSGPRPRTTPGWASSPIRAATPTLLEELGASGGRLSAATRADLALEAFAHTATYDAAIVRWLDPEPTAPAPHPAARPGGAPAVRREPAPAGCPVPGRPGRVAGSTR